MSPGTLVWTHDLNGRHSGLHVGKILAGRRVLDEERELWPMVVWRRSRRCWTKIPAHRPVVRVLTPEEIARWNAQDEEDAPAPTELLGGLIAAVSGRAPRAWEARPKRSVG